ncbi:hypothetical protein [Desulfurobacterium sp.]
MEKELKGLSEEETIEKLFVLAYGPKESWTPEISGHYDAIVYALRKKLRAKDSSFKEESEEISFDTSAAVPTEVSRVVEEVESGERKPKKEDKKEEKSIKSKIGLKGLDGIGNI